ncbi:MAG: SCO family protein, partial [Verrucomicrobiales bacterium]
MKLFSGKKPSGAVSSIALTLAGIAVIMLFGILVAYNYVLRSRMEQGSARPPYLGKLEKDLALTNRTGEGVRLSMLRGKLWVAAHLSTECPGNCIALAAEMADLLRRYGGDERFRMVSFSVDPPRDTAEKMNAFIAAHGIDDPDWWFLTGDPETLENYLVGYFRFAPARENQDPETIEKQGRWTHDSRLVLVDGKGNIRGYY